MKIDPKMLVSDYDETFYLNDEDIEKNKQAVGKLRKAGNIFVIATGRSYLDFFNKLESKYNRFKLEKSCYLGNGIDFFCKYLYCIWLLNVSN